MLNKMTTDFDKLREIVTTLTNEQLKKREIDLTKKVYKAITHEAETELAIVRHELFKRGGVSAIHKKAV